MTRNAIKRPILLFLSGLLLILSLTGCSPETAESLLSLYDWYIQSQQTSADLYTPGEPVTFSLPDGTTATVSAYDTEPFIEVNDGKPTFTKKEITRKAFEQYAKFDDLNRCGPAMACLGPETLPTEARGAIGQVKPSGWHSVKYPKQIKDLYLYNRCHLIAYELSAENANRQNLVTGTRYLNIEGMLPFENATRKYIDETGNHVMYRSTPVFLDDELVCRGILMEIYSVEDKGKGLNTCIFCYNVQPGIAINYATGESQET